MSTRWVTCLAAAVCVSACGPMDGAGNEDQDRFYTEESVEVGPEGEKSAANSLARLQSVTSSVYVSRFELYNATTGTLLRTLVDGDVIDIAKDGAALTIRARAGGSGYESVKFELDGT